MFHFKHMDDEYDISKVPFFTDYQGEMGFNFDLPVITNNVVAEPQQVDALDLFHVKQNVAKLSKTITRLEEMLKNELNKSS